MTAYPLIKDKKTIKSSVDVTATEAFENVDFDPELPLHAHMLKMDETFVDGKIRWCPLDNKLYGFCYEHGREENLQFKSYKDVKRLAEKVEMGELHVGKECMVIATSCNAIKQNSQVVIAWPTCSKS